jgi:hypothetical protein
VACEPGDDLSLVIVMAVATVFQITAFDLAGCFVCNLMNHSHIGRARLNGSPQDRAAEVRTTSAPQVIPGLTPDRHGWGAAESQWSKTRISSVA